MIEETERDIDYWKQKLQVWSNDPYQWCVDCVWTKDPADEKEPVKRFPGFAYFKVYARVWLSEPKVAVPKSRRMFMSWGNLALHLWWLIFRPGAQIGVVSKKEDDSDELIKRMVFMFGNIKEEDWPSDLRPKMTDKYNTIEFPQLGSKAMGFAQGGDQLRQFGFSRLLFDEMAFWERAKEMYSGAIPTLEGGGRITCISSAAPGFFKDLVHDQINQGEAPTPRRMYPMQGVEVWRNPKNKFVIFQLHYTANEAKRNPEYRENMKSGMPYSQFMQEFEISWETPEGKPVYTDWNKAIHGNKEEEYPDIGVPLFLGVDQGLTPACVVFQPKGADIVILREYTAENMGAERFKDYVKAQLRIDFKEWNNFKEDFIIGMDPTGFNRRDVDERTYASVWLKDFKVFPGENSFEKRKQSVEDRLVRFTKGLPTFRVNLSTCPVLVRGFSGEYHYPDKMFEVEPNKARPLKNFCANAHDALQYGLTVFNKQTKKLLTRVPEPGYAFKGGMRANG